MHNTAGILNKFNPVRNSQSYAHNNDILNEKESHFIYNEIVNIFKFIKSIENEQFN